MGKKELKNRLKWQTDSGYQALSFEDQFNLIFKKEFEKEKYLSYRIRKNPKEFVNIYEKVKLDKKTLKEIYTPDKKYKHGIVLDFAIDNIITKKTIYVELKRQDGWVENLPSSAGRGNAHERLCKLFTPGLLKILQEQSKVEPNYLPFWIVFGGNITRDPKRVREITIWFDKYKNNFFMWRDTNNKNSLIEHFNKKLKCLLD